jgi:hypothetical protein
MVRKSVGAWLTALIVGLQATVNIAEARVEKTIHYTKDQSYNAALRFLRVDQGYTVVEKDLDSGYLLFEYPSEGSKEATNGSIEVIERGEEISLIIQLPQMPHQHERMLADALLKKLRADYGEPTKRRKIQPEEPPADEAPKQDKDEAPEEPPPTPPKSP